MSSSLSLSFLLIVVALVTPLHSIILAPKLASHKVRYESLGCWKDEMFRSITNLERLANDPDLKGDYKDREDAVDKCASAAERRGYPVFAVQDGGQCRSSFDADLTYNKYGKSNRCLIDGEGGRFANHVYKITSELIKRELKFESLGCWKDFFLRAIDTLEGEEEAPLLDGDYQDRKDAILKCAAAADQLGYKVFALQNGGECYSSADAGSTYKAHGVSKDCRLDGEGGPWSNHVYRITPKQLPEVLHIEDLGCWRDMLMRTMNRLEGTDPLLDGEYKDRVNASEKCAEVAYKRGYRVYALQDGGQCLSGLEAHTNYYRYGESEHCNQDGRGGPWANHVYKFWAKSDDATDANSKPANNIDNDNKQSP